EMSYHGLSQHVNFEELPAPGDRFVLQELIGEGTYGEVYSARDTITGKLPFMSSPVSVTRRLCNICSPNLWLMELNPVHISRIHTIYIYIRSTPILSSYLYCQYEYSVGGAALYIYSQPTISLLAVEGEFLPLPSLIHTKDSEFSTWLLNDSSCSAKKHTAYIRQLTT
ncbi:hypothetical protein L9F63_026776, partial [Diploptera punctata]